MVSDNVTQNLTGQRMHVDGPQISEMNPYNNSFQEIGTCFWQILTVWPGKFVSSKKTPQNGLFFCARIWDTWLWKAFWGRRYQNWAHTTPCRSIFFPMGHGNWWESDFFGKTLRTQKNSQGNFLGASTHGILTHSGFRKCIWWQVIEQKLFEFTLTLS